MTHRFLAMVKTVIDACAHNREQVALNGKRDVFAQNVSAQRQWQARLALPPFAEVDDLCESRALVGELALVNDQAGIGFAALHRVEDLVERNYDVLEITQVKLEREKCARHFSWYGNRLFL